MAAISLAGLFQAGVDILKTTINTKTKRILASTGSNGKPQTPDTDNVEYWQHVGFASRPSVPDPGLDAAQGFVVRAGDYDICLASQDMRGLDIYGSLADGETALYAGGVDTKAQARIILKANGSINLLTRKGNTAAGQAMGVFVNADGSISIASPSGGAVLIGTDGGVKLFNAAGAVQIDGGGTVKISSTAKVNVSAPTVTIGGPTALPVAMAPSVLVALTALQVEIAAVAAALVAVTNITGPITPAHATAAGAATGAVGVGGAALVAASVTIPSMRVSAD